MLRIDCSTHHRHKIASKSMVGPVLILPLLNSAILFHSHLYNDSILFHCKCDVAFRMQLAPSVYLLDSVPSPSLSPSIVFCAGPGVSFLAPS